VQIRAFPWLSLGLLLVSYSTFSWYLYNSTTSWIIWVTVIAFSILQALLLTTFADGLRSIIDAWLQSDIGYFTTVIVGALLLAFALIWINILGYILVLLASEMLARLDLQRIGCNRIQSLFLLTGVSLLGLYFGHIISQFL